MVALFQAYGLNLQALMMTTWGKFLQDGKEFAWRDFNLTSLIVTGIFLILSNYPVYFAKLKPMFS